MNMTGINNYDDFRSDLSEDYYLFDFSNYLYWIVVIVNYILLILQLVALCNKKLTVIGFLNPTFFTFFANLICGVHSATLVTNLRAFNDYFYAGTGI